MASHLLGEIERVSDFLVAIDAGRLLRAAPLGTLHRADRATSRSRWRRGRRRWPAARCARGLAPAVDGRTVVVPIEDDRPYDIVRDALAELGLPLVRLEQRRKGLEDLFADGPRVPGGAGAGPPRGRPVRSTDAANGIATMTAPVPAASSVTATTATGPGGSIYDLGYQGYHGPGSAAGARRSRCSARRCGPPTGSGAAAGPRSRRSPSPGWRSCRPSWRSGSRRCLRGPGPATRSRAPRPVRYETYHGLTVTLLMLFCAAQAPELFGRDQRYGVLPLYFSRALTRTDYALARVGGLVVALLIVDLVPAGRSCSSGGSSWPRTR